MSRTPLILATALGLSACATTPPPPQAVAPSPAPIRTMGLERVMGQNAATLTGLFGAADSDVSEAGGRRLQFASSICILDAYLYPSGRSREAVVGHVDARQPDGRDIDRASCVAAMVRRREAR